MATPPIKTPTCIFLSLHSKPIVPSMELKFHAHKPRSRNKFVGVRQRASGKWVAEIKNTTQKIRMWLGTFDTAEEAARAYDEAACLLHGSNARTNFFNSGPCKPELSLKIRNLLNQKRGLNKATQPPSPSSNTNTGKFSIQESTRGNIASNTVYLMDAYKPDLSCYIGGYDQMYSSSPHFIYSCQDSTNLHENINVQKDGVYVRRREGEVMNEVQLPDFERMEGEKEISSKSLNANECNDPLWDILTLYQMFCQS